MSGDRKFVLAFAAFALAGAIVDICVRKYANAGFIGGMSIIASLYLLYPEEE